MLRAGIIATALCGGWLALQLRAAEATAAANAAHASHSKIDSAARAFWAFRVLSRPALPAAPAGQVRTPVDAFILARLTEHGLPLSAEADRMTQLRRATLDLTGLPPTPAEIEVFASDDRPDAYERLVDRLLASPAFGERWGRHWLDAAGYSDITGGDNDAGIIKLSEGKWKYRDWVVRAFNEDKPYERFVTEQLAGDELVDWRAADSFTPEMKDLLVATGFLRNAADDTDEKELTTPDILHGVLQRTGEVVANNLLGLTLACAKCHDHKYEPIPQEDYYRLMAAFTPTFNPTGWVQPKNRALADIAPKQKAAAEKHNADIDRQVAELQKSQAAIKDPVKARLFEAKLATISEPIRADVKTAVETEAKKRSEVQKYLAEKFQAALAVSDAEIVAALAPEDRVKLNSAGQRVAELGRDKKTWGTIQAAYDVGPPPATYVLVRGNHETPGDAVEPGFLNVLSALESAGTAADAGPVSQGLRPSGATSGRRLALAHWLTDWDSPAGGLGARVMVNRVWQHLFGRGLVETSENLGVSGAAPTHPELLEWLACEFVADGRRIKPLVKELMMSAVYRQASARTVSRDRAPGAPSTVDPSNRWLWHMPLKRLEAEVVRDAILAASGQLDPTLGGPSVGVEVRPDGMVIISEKGNTVPGGKLRRSLYVLARRNYHLSMLGVFDQPAMSTNCPHRQQSAVVLQSLAMLNDEFVIDQARQFAARVRTQSGDDSSRQIVLAFRIALGRDPSTDENSWANQLLAEQSGEPAASVPADEARQNALTHLCQMLLNANEFLYVP